MFAWTHGMETLLHVQIVFLSCSLICIISQLEQKGNNATFLNSEITTEIFRFTAIYTFKNVADSERLQIQKCSSHKTNEFKVIGIYRSSHLYGAYMTCSFFSVWSLTNIVTMNSPWRKIFVKVLLLCSTHFKLNWVWNNVRVGKIITEFPFLCVCKLSI